MLVRFKIARDLGLVEGLGLSAKKDTELPLGSLSWKRAAPNALDAEATLQDVTFHSRISSESIVPATAGR